MTPPLKWLIYRRDGTLVVRSPRGSRSWPLGRTSASREEIESALRAALARRPHPPANREEAHAHVHDRIAWAREVLAAAGIPLCEPVTGDDLLTPTAVAERRDCSPGAVMAAIRRGELQATMVLGPGGAPSTYGVRPEDADAWIPRGVGRPSGS